MFAVVGVIINLLSGGNPLGFIGAVALFVFWLWIDYQRSKKSSQQLVFSVSKEYPQGARGLILLLSPYAPRNPVLREEQKLKPLLKHILDTPVEQLQLTDFNDIDLFNSNLVPQIKAVEYHWEQGKLRDVWLISSETYEHVKGSEVTAQILQQYLRFHYSQKLNINAYGLVVKDFDYKGLWELGEQIFRESGYKDDVLVADITGGTKMMSMALAMVCIPPRRRMQYMDSQRDWQGNPLPKGEMKPVVIDVDPIFYS